MNEVRFIANTEVMSLLRPDDVLEAVAAALYQLSNGEASVPPRVGAFTPDGLIGVMPGYLAGGPACVKLVSVFPGNRAHDRPTHQAIIVVFDPATGTPQAVMDGTVITTLRTAATSAVAARVLPAQCRALAILGAGVQGRAHLDALSRIHPLEEIRIASRSRERAESLADAHPGARVAVTFEEAVRSADVVCCCTSSAEPVIERTWLKAGTHVSSVGTGREIDTATVAASNLFVECRGAVTNPPPAGAVELQGVDPNRVTEIGEVLDGATAGRRSADEITLFKSTGHAVEDIATAALVHQRAVAAEIGTTVNLGGFGENPHHRPVAGPPESDDRNAATCTEQRTGAGRSPKGGPTPLAHSAPRGPTWLAGDIVLALGQADRRAEPDEVVLSTTWARGVASRPTVPAQRGTTVAVPPGVTVQWRVARRVPDSARIDTKDATAPRLVHPTPVCVRLWTRRHTVRFDRSTCLAAIERRSSDLNQLERSRR